MEIHEKNRAAIIHIIVSLSGRWCRRSLAAAGHDTKEEQFSLHAFIEQVQQKHTLRKMQAEASRYFDDKGMIRRADIMLLMTLRPDAS